MLVVQKDKQGKDASNEDGIMKKHIILDDRIRIHHGLEAVESFIVCMVFYRRFQLTYQTRSTYKIFLPTPQFHPYYKRILQPDKTLRLNPL